MDRPVVSENERFYLGDIEDAMSLVDLCSEGEFAVRVATGMDTRVDILNRDGKICTPFETSKREAIGSFDIKKVETGYVMACIRSSGPNKEAPNVWVGESSGTQRVCAHVMAQEIKKLMWYNIAGTYNETVAVSFPVDRIIKPR
jgi:hypothetical protein